jgi:alanine racemase
LAVLPVGYDDGYLRRLSGKAEVIIAGQRVPILGRICMNACLADITDLGQIRVGDEAVLMGCQGDAEITADEIAGWSDTISYEILCLFGGSNRRVYLPH